MSSTIIDIERANSVIPRFKKYLKNEGSKWQEDRIIKEQFMTDRFAKNKLSKLEEGDLRELIQMLWAFLGWTNKDYLVEEMLKTGIKNIRHSIEYLLYSNDPLVNRFEKAKEVRMLGAAGISEILIHFDYNEYALWNRRARKGLISLGVPAEKLPKSAQISGSQYVKYCSLVKKVFSEIKGLSPEINDLFALDFLLYYLAVEDPEIKIQVSPKKDFDHGTAIDQLLELGDGLGFEIEKEYKAASGCQIDALWRSRIANLGTISYAFEVHRRGSRDSAILNL